MEVLMIMRNIIYLIVLVVVGYFVLTYFNIL